MGRRISHSMLDPYFAPLARKAYQWLPIPRWFPPEGIVVIGHLWAAVGAVGFAYCTTTWWGGLLAAAGAGGNHLSDMVDGAHARTTGQCRNGGELLDHLLDPISFSYWIVGMAVAVGRLDLGLAGVIILNAIALLTSIKAKITGEFTLAAFGPTEFKAVLVIFGLGMSGYMLAGGASLGAEPRAIALTVFIGLLALGAVLLPMDIIRSVREVNRSGAPPDTTWWVIARNEDEARK